MYVCAKCSEIPALWDGQTDRQHERIMPQTTADSGGGPNKCVVSHPYNRQDVSMHTYERVLSCRPPGEPMISPRVQKVWPRKSCRGEKRFNSMTEAKRESWFHNRLWLMVNTHKYNFQIFNEWHAWRRHGAILNFTHLKDSAVCSVLTDSNLTFSSRLYK